MRRKAIVLMICTVGLAAVGPTGVDARDAALLPAEREAHEAALRATDYHRTCDEMRQAVESERRSTIDRITQQYEQARKAEVELWAQADAMAITATKRELIRKANEARDKKIDIGKTMGPAQGEYARTDEQLDLLEASLKASAACLTHLRYAQVSRAVQSQARSVGKLREAAKMGAAPRLKSQMQDIWTAAVSDYCTALAELIRRDSQERIKTITDADPANRKLYDQLLKVNPVAAGTLANRVLAAWLSIERETPLDMKQSVVARFWLDFDAAGQPPSPNEYAKEVAAIRARLATVSATTSGPSTKTPVDTDDEDVGDEKNGAD